VRRGCVGGTALGGERAGVAGRRCFGLVGWGVGAGWPGSCLGLPELPSWSWRRRDQGAWVIPVCSGGGSFQNRPCKNRCAKQGGPRVFLQNKLLLETGQRDATSRDTMLY
jgi:hypothetical protein